MEDYQTLCFVFNILVCTLGLTLNITFLIVNGQHLDLFKVYGYFLSSLCLNNVIHLTNGLLLQTSILYLDSNPKSAFCSVVAIISVATAYNGVCIEAVVALNRYIALYFPERQLKIFSSKNNFVIIFALAIYTVATAVGLFLLDDIARVGNTVCGPELESMEVGHILYFLGPISCVKTLSVFCVYKIWRLIKNHQQYAQRLGSGLQDAEDIVRLIAIELLIPICLEYPLLLVCLLNKHVFIPKMVISAFCCLFVASSVFDPIIIVIVMKPYRKLFQKMWLRFKGSIITDSQHTAITC